jgi:hypothetical protein
MWSQTLPGRRVTTIFDSEPHTFTNVNAAVAAATAAVIVVVLFCGRVDASEGVLKLFHLAAQPVDLCLLLVCLLLHPLAVELVALEPPPLLVLVLVLVLLLLLLLLLLLVLVLVLLLQLPLLRLAVVQDPSAV